MRSLRDVADIAQQDVALDGAYQWAIDQFVDDFRRSPPERRMDLIDKPPEVADDAWRPCLLASSMPCARRPGPAIPNGSPA